MRFALASLFIVFPLFLLVSWILNKIYARESVVRESKIRKWLIYLTLFIAALVIIGDLVFVINTFLNGELTTRFLLKALSVIIVAGAIFGYYLDDVRKNKPTTLAKPFAWGTLLVVAALVIGAFFIVGSPKQARLQQFDQQRLNDLQGIQWQVVNYWQQKGQLPVSLTDLNDSISGYIAPMDPETRMPYQYIIKNAATLNFQLCATFNAASDTNNPKTVPVPAMYPNDMSQVWNHPVGYFCFDRTIDQQLYPPLNKGK
jgi:hypothetical protein